jgi:selenocysteine lyase/cysteine desulfurase
MLTDDERRRSFPSLEGMTYLNSAAEGIPPLVVGEALGQYFRDKQLGMEGRPLHFAQWERARALAGGLLGLSADEVAICSCSSEAYNLAALALRPRPGDEVVLNDLDFPAGATPWLQADCPASAKLWKSRDGALHVDDLIPLLGPRTRLVTASLVSFFNGFVLPLEEVVAAIRSHSPALLALDVTQALGRIPLKLDGVDLIVSSTHKWILASHGGGIVGVPSARASEWTVPAGGWLHLEDAFGPGRFEAAVSRPGAQSFAVGMPNFPAIYAIRAALEYISGIGVDRIEQAARPLVDACLDGLRSLPVDLLTPRRPDRLAGILAFRHDRADEIHRQLLARGFHLMSHAGRLRVAIHGYNRMGEIERFLESMAELVGTRSDSPSPAAAGAIAAT